MSDDIKLPELGEMTLHMWQDCLVHYNKELTKRAHRIAKLKAALRDVIDNYFDSTRICEIARKALEGKDD